jgi:hypothetical protein
VSKRTDSPGLGSLASGALTAGSMLVVSGMAAAVGIVIAREFGRTEETDGLLAAYGLFIVLAVAAQAIRIAVLPQLARARAEGRLAGDLAGFALALTALALPLVLVAELGAHSLAGLLTGDAGGVAEDTAADALRWIVPAAVAQLFAALAASGLAALDDYVIAALGYAAGSTAGFTFIVSRVDADGIVAVAWGMMLNGTIALLVPLVGLAWRATRTGMPGSAVRPSGQPLRRRLGTFAVGASLPLALQLLYVVCLPFAAREGEGEATTFVYAYLAAATLVTVTAGSLGLVTSVPLSRSALSATNASRHVVAAAWLSLALVGAACGVLALAGGDVVEAVLGGAYGGEVGSELGRLVIVLSPWIIASIGISLAFPLAFVTSRSRSLPWIAIAALVLQLPLSWLGAELLDLEGLALSLALTAALVCAALLESLGVLAGTGRGLIVAALVVATLTAIAFIPPSLVLGSLASAVVGVALYVVLLAVLRPRGLVSGWHYLRALG